jgi:MerR family transcriptional regulator, copper efflux regulator
MGDLRYEHRRLDVACELQAGAAVSRLDEWRRLRETAGLRADPIDGGIRLLLRPEARIAVERLVRQEAHCCGFLDFELTTVGDKLRLDITSPSAEAVGVIDILTGTDRAGGSPCC